LRRAIGAAHFSEVWLSYSRAETLRVTPAMELGLSGHPWTMDELVAIMEEKSN